MEKVNNFFKERKDGKEAEVTQDRFQQCYTEMQKKQFPAYAEFSIDAHVSS